MGLKPDIYHDYMFVLVVGQTCGSAKNKSTVVD